MKAKLLSCLLQGFIDSDTPELLYHCSLITFALNSKLVLCVLPSPQQPQGLEMSILISSLFSFLLCLISLLYPSAPTSDLRGEDQEPAVMGSESDGQTRG